MLGNVCSARCLAAFLWFLLGCATSAGQIALLSLLTYYSRMFGLATFVRLNCALYLPSLPIVLLQRKLDNSFERRFSTATAFSFRISVSLVAIVMTLIALIYIPNDEGTLLACAAVIGIFTGAVFGNFYQLLALLDNQKQTTAAFAFGYQFSGLIVFVLSLAAFGDNEEFPTHDSLEQFFFSVSAVPLLALFVFTMFTWSDTFQDAARKRDGISYAGDEVQGDNRQPLIGEVSGEVDAGAERSENESRSLLRSLAAEYVGYDTCSVRQGDDGGILSSMHEQELLVAADGNTAGHGGSGDECVGQGGGGESSEEDFESLSQMQILERCFPCVACIFCTIFASIVVFPFYTFVPSTNPQFAMILFYTKVCVCVCMNYPLSLPLSGCAVDGGWFWPTHTRQCVQHV